MDAGEARQARLFVGWLELRYTQHLIKSLRFGGRFRCCRFFSKDFEGGSAVMEESLDRGREKVTKKHQRQWARARATRGSGRGGQHVVRDLASQS